MAFKLAKGMSFNLDKDGDKLRKVRVVLNWDPSEAESRGKFDADLSIAVLADDGTGKKTIFAEDERYLVFYNSNPKRTPKDEVIHSGDDRTGADGEQADIDLSKMLPDVAEIAIVGTIHKGTQRGQNWNMLKASMRLDNSETNETVAQYQLGSEFPEDTAVQFGSFYRNDKGEWEFAAMGVGHKAGLEAFIAQWT